MSELNRANTTESKPNWSRRLKISTIVGAGVLGFATASHSGYSPEKALVMGFGASLGTAGLMFLAYLIF